MNKFHTSLTAGQLEKLRKLDFSKVPGITSGNKYLDEKYGPKGTPGRDAFEAKAEAYYYGEMLRTRRKELGLTQKELAEQIGRERSYINRIEKGETDMQLSSFLRIATALGITVQLTVNL